jgi:phospho-N-acetylmuramoyl-pentapeptide-transferase
MNPYIYSSLAFVLAILIARPIINFLTRIKSIQSFREQGPQSHIRQKSGTPTMGGWIFLIPILLIGFLVYLQTHSKALLIGLIAILIGALMGAVDDTAKIMQANYKGIDSRLKLFIQLLTSSGITYFSERYLFAGINPELPEWMSPVLILFEFVWAFFVIAGTSNAINLSDGLDGLATILSILAYGALAVILWTTGDFYSVTLCLIVCSGLAGFLFFNFKPAKIFMGDTGSLALGMGLGCIAYLNKLEWYLLVIALVPVLETISVMLQVASSQLSRRILGKDLRPFKMAPLHHHFELCGIPELIVVLGFSFFQLLVTIIFFTLQLKVS